MLYKDMYSSRGGSSYGQQTYGNHSGYSQNLGNAYAGNSEGTTESGGGMVSSRHSSVLGGAGSHETGVSSYRSHVTASSSQYGAQYGSVYGSAHSGVSQIPNMSNKSGVTVSIEGRGLYSSSVSDSPKFVAGEYGLSSNYGYARKNDTLYVDKLPDFHSAGDRQHYNDRKGAYLRDLPSEPTTLCADGSLSHQHQKNVLRQEQLLKSRSLQSSSMDSSSRQIDYLSSRGVTIRHLPHQIVSYEGKVDPDPHNSSLSSSPYVAHHTPSILGAVPRRAVDNIMPSHSGANPGYGISLPPGRDYGTGKGLHGSTFEPEYRGLVRNNEFRDDRNDYLWDLEQREERRQELLRERKREDRERDREREREREWERNRERERVRLRKREKRDRMLEWREKERERERKRAMEIRQERTPTRVSRDRRGSSMFKNTRPGRPISPVRGTSHRRHSPPKEKRREYVCKVYLSNLVAVERDHLSIDRRYPRLFVSPEFTKAVVDWHRKDLKLPINNPVSLEHEILEEMVSERRNHNFVSPSHSLPPLENCNTVWNSKIVLMSGGRLNPLQEFSADKNPVDRFPHLCSILRFAVLKKDSALMAIGGPWDPADGGDPSINDSCLVQTAIRHAKDTVHLDLQKCVNWNPFLQIHYDRFGEDGFLSHKEVTVLFVPDLSECLPSLETWKEQFAAHKSSVKEREQRLHLQAEKNGEKKDEHTGEIMNVTKAVAVADGDDFMGKVKGNGTEKGNVVMENVECSSRGQSIITTPTGKKKIIRRIIRQKVSDKTNDKEVVSEDQFSGFVKQDDNSGDLTDSNTGVTKMVVKNLSADKQMETDLEAKVKENCDAVIGAAAGLGTISKMTVKKKIVKRVVKKKVSASLSNSEAKDDIKSGADSNLSVENADQVAEAKSIATEEEIINAVPISSVVSTAPDEEMDGRDQADRMRDGAGTCIFFENDREADEIPGLSDKVLMDKVKHEELPSHSGLILRTNEKSIKSTTVTLESLLDYTDKDVDESTFELSLFAESFYEMLQYQLGTRILNFLQKLRVKFVTQRNERKRQREEADLKDKTQPCKRVKDDEISARSDCPKSEKLEEAKVATHQSPTPDEKSLDSPTIDHENEAKPDVESDFEVAPEYPEEVDEEPAQESPKEMNEETENGDLFTDNELPNEPEKLEGEEMDVKGNEEDNLAAEADLTCDEQKMESSAEPKSFVDHELLQAFRFFDRSQAGYIRVEDMRLIIHSLGKFLCHRDVKELVQSALFESNTGRDDRILYENLVRMVL